MLDSQLTAPTPLLESMVNKSKSSIFIITHSLYDDSYDEKREINTVSFTCQSQQKGLDQLRAKIANHQNGCNKETRAPNQLKAWLLIKTNRARFLWPS